MEGVCCIAYGFIDGRAWPKEGAKSTESRYRTVCLFYIDMGSVLFVLGVWFLNFGSRVCSGFGMGFRLRAGSAVSRLMVLIVSLMVFFALFFTPLIEKRSFAYPAYGSMGLR